MSTVRMDLVKGWPHLAQETTLTIHFSSPSVDATQDNGRFGRLLNHSKTAANVVTKLYEVDSQPYLGLIAARDIQPGEELQYDYGERSSEALLSHPWLAS